MVTKLLSSVCWRCATTLNALPYHRPSSVPPFSSNPACATNSRSILSRHCSEPPLPQHASRKQGERGERWNVAGVELERTSCVLGIETSCDDTGVAMVTMDGKVLGEAVHSQLKVHQSTGGVVPNVAAQLHGEGLQKAVDEVLERSKRDLEEVSIVAVTTGPGLALCLKEGLNFAKELARRTSKPMVSVHHMEAHALTPRLTEDIPFPYLVLLVSGGHCILAVVRGPGEFVRLGSSWDDAPGEAFDKVARWLHLDKHPEVGHLSGGAAIEVLARRGDASKYKLPHIMATSLCCNFSFSGLKTATHRLIDAVAREEEREGVEGKEEGGPVKDSEDIAVSFQDAVSRHLVTRTHRAILFCQQWEPGVRNLVVSGGVASNRYIRSQLKSLVSAYNYSLHCPPPELCTDNGVMIAWAAIEHLKIGKGIVSDVDALDFKPRWLLGTDHTQQVESEKIKVPKLMSL